MALVKDLTQRLEDVERRVAVLVKRDDGSTDLVSFDDESDDG
jgi:exonuclease VII small subunit